MYIVQKQINGTWQNEANSAIYMVALCKVLELMRYYKTRIINEQEGWVVYYDRGG